MKYCPTAETNNIKAQVDNLPRDKGNRRIYPAELKQAIMKELSYCHLGIRLLFCEYIGVHYHLIYKWERSTKMVNSGIYATHNSGIGIDTTHSIVKNNRISKDKLTIVKLEAIIATQKDFINLLLEDR